MERLLGMVRLRDMVRLQDTGPLAAATAPPVAGRTDDTEDHLAALPVAQEAGPRATVAAGIRLEATVREGIGKARLVVQIALTAPINCADC
jgi:hypothetical protein